jgi:hypothetical protein
MYTSVTIGRSRNFRTVEGRGFGGYHETLSEFRAKLWWGSSQKPPEG